MYGRSLSPYRNPLAYPAGYAPGFDPNMVPGTVRFSAVADSSGWNVLTGGSRGSVSYAADIKRYLITGGPGRARTSINETITGMPAVADTFGTMAAIATWFDFTDEHTLFTSSNTDPGGINVASIITAGTIRVSPNPNYGGWTSTITVPLNVPVLIIAVQGLSVTRLLISNLATGQTVFETSASGSTPSASNGTYNLCGNLYGNHSRQAKHAVAYIGGALSVPQMLAWAADPWIFWYPNPGDNWGQEDLLAQAVY